MRASMRVTGARQMSDGEIKRRDGTFVGKKYIHVSYVKLLNDVTGGIDIRTRGPHNYLGYNRNLSIDNTCCFS